VVAYRDTMKRMISSKNEYFFAKLHAMQNSSKNFFRLFLIHASIEREQLITNNWFLAFEKLILGGKNFKN
jgi:hypothetical protein